ncbi:hypothetical protein EBT25_19260 [bacterium]|jgi:hypothetical protein|nr:hypothetical protein [bacterium]
MKPAIEQILKSPAQDLFVYDKVSKHWYSREDSDYICPEVSIDVYTQLVVRSVLDTLEDCSAKNLVDGNTSYDYDRFFALINERFFSGRLNKSKTPEEQGILFHWV